MVNLLSFPFLFSPPQWFVAFRTLCFLLVFIFFTIKLLMFISRNVLQMSFSLFPSTTVGTLFLFIKISTFEASQKIK